MLFFLSYITAGSSEQICESEPKQKIIIKIMSSSSRDGNFNVTRAERNLGAIRSAPLL